jgi:hypothetical protein
MSRRNICNHGERKGKVAGLQYKHKTGKAIKITPEEDVAAGRVR